MENVFDRLQPVETEQQPVMDALEIGITAFEVRGWNQQKDVLRQRLIGMTGADPGDHYRTPWEHLNPLLRDRIREIARDNPRVGPDMGLIPEDGMYSNGLTLVEAVKEKGKWKTWV